MGGSDLVVMVWPGLGASVALFWFCHGVSCESQEKGEMQKKARCRCRTGGRGKAEPNN